METIKSWTLSHEGLLLKVNDCYAVIHASVETVFGLCIYVYVLLVLCLFFFYEYLIWIERYCIFDREGEVASSWMLHEEMFE